jgi:type IV pilus assembly protein PilC
MGQALPLHTRLLFFVSESLATYGLWLAAILATCFFTVRWLCRTNPIWRHNLDAIKIRLPVTGSILKKIILARFSGLFAMLYGAGIPVLQALQSTHGVIGNQLIADALLAADKSIQEGRSISDAFRQTGLFPPLLLRMLHVGETTGKLDQAMRNVAYFYQRDIKESVGKAQTLIEPLLTVVMGLLLGWIMLAVIGPIYDVISRIKL